MDRFACPTPDRMGRYRCIEDHVLCDGYIDCPKGEDEDRQSCMFFKTVCIKQYLLNCLHEAQCLSEVILHFYGAPKEHYRVHKNPQPNSILRQFSLVYNFNIISPTSWLPRGSVHFESLDQIFVYVLLLPRIFCMSRPCKPVFDQRNNICLRIHTFQLIDLKLFQSTLLFILP
jgi:hypothetical protein